MKLMAQDSHTAQRVSPGTLKQCSTQVGWQSLLLQSYINPLEIENLILPATSDHQIVLVTAGTCQIESHSHGSWHRAKHQPGDLGMTAPGRENRLRWRSGQVHHTLHLHLPCEILMTVHRELGSGAAPLADLPNLLQQADPLTAAVMAALEQAMCRGAPELYAQSSAYFLATHLLTSCSQELRPSRPTGAAALRQVDDYMRSHLAAPLTLDQLALIAGLSPFQFLRAAKVIWHETPMRRLTRLRMELAQHLLERNDNSVSEVALSCGYTNPSHFATAFRRVIGVAPTAFQRLH